jgi:hypothetical protein
MLKQALAWWLTLILNQNGKKQKQKLGQSCAQ